LPLASSSRCPPVTADIGRGEKWHAYRGLPSLRAYLLADSVQRQVDYYLRDADGDWAVGKLEAGEVLNLECGKLVIPLLLEDLYEDVDLM